MKVNPNGVFNPPNKCDFCRDSIKEMDIVLRRDGIICWVMYNTGEHGLTTFLPDLWGQHSVSDDYNYDLSYYDSNWDRYDIVGVARFETNWWAMVAMKNYLDAVKNHESVENIMNKWNWVYYNR